MKLLFISNSRCYFLVAKQQIKIYHNKGQNMFKRKYQSYFILIITSLTFLCLNPISSHAKNDKIARYYHHSHYGNRYTQPGPPPRRFDIGFWRHRYYRARKLRNMGIGFTITGILSFVITSTVIPNIMHNDFGAYAVITIGYLAGFGLTGAGIPMWIVGQIKKGRAGRRLRRARRYYHRRRRYRRYSSKIVPMPPHGKLSTFVISQ